MAVALFVLALAQTYLYGLCHGFLWTEMPAPAWTETDECAPQVSGKAGEDRA